MNKQLPNSLLKMGLGLSFAVMSWNANTYAQTWENVGLTAEVSSGGSSYNNLVIDNDGNYYISYYDVSVAKGSVQKFNGTDWSYVGGSAGITTDIATFNSLSINSIGQLYYTNQISWPGAGMEVRYFNGTAWSLLTNPVSTGINYHASAVSSDDIVYVFSGEGTGTVKKYVDGAWLQVGTSGFSGGATFAEMLFDADDNLYVSVANGSAINVYTIAGDADNTTPWTLVGGASIGTASSGEQYTADIAVDNSGNLFAAYISNAASERKINVKKFNGTSWVAVGVTDFSDDPVQHMALTVSTEGVPYVVASYWGSESELFLRNKVYAFHTATNSWTVLGGDFVSEGEAKFNDIKIDETGNYVVIVYSGEEATEVKRFSLEGSIDPPLPIVDSVAVKTDSGVPAIIDEVEGTLSLLADVYPASVDQEVIWSIVSGDEYGSISTSGEVTAMADGVIVLRATSTLDDTKYDDLSVVISNQTINIVTTVEVSTTGGVASIINMPSGELHLESTVIPAAASQEVTWSISAGEELANVDPVGIVTAIQNGFVTVRATSTENSSIFDEIIVEITNQETTSIPQIYQKLFSLYPNPAKDYIRVHSEKPIKMVSILNILGQKIHTTTESNIQLSGWSNGIYIMKIETIDNQSVQLKFEKI